MGPALAILLLLQASPEEAAVRKALTAIRASAGRPEHRDLLLWTLADCGVDASDPVLGRLIQDALSEPVATTASAAMQAMAFDVLDPAKYRPRLADCAQFLVDNQTLDGLWDAGRPVPSLGLPAPDPPPPPKRGEFAPPRPALPKVSLTRRADGPARGDLANARWAALGLQACRSAGVLAPADVSIRGEASWRGAAANAADVASCLSIHLFHQNKKWKTDPDVLKAVERLADPARPTDPRSLAALKRAMFHVGRDKIDGTSWWPEGVKVLLAAQAPDGTWGALEDTCAAARYLHLRRHGGIEEYGRR